MDGRSTAADSQHPYQSSPWIRAVPGTLTSAAPPEATAAPVAFAQRPPRIDFIPILFPHHSSLYQAHLDHYNKLFAPGRGGGGGYQTTTLSSASVFAALPIQAAPRSRSSSKVAQTRDTQQLKFRAQNCHVPRLPNTTDKTDRAAMTSGKEGPHKMPGKKRPESSNRLPSKPANQVGRTGGSPLAQSSSVPSTPHQHARKFSFESREPSPNAAQNHSPRSAYSETNSTLPSLRPLPPRLGGCRYETGLVHSRRRMPYSLGSDKLEKTDQAQVKSKLSEDEERKLETNMRELYDRLLPTEGIEQNRQKLVTKLEKIFNDEWPGHNIQVHLFGSSGNLLCSDDSDVDICITTELEELEQVCKIADLLAKHGMQKVVCVSSAKVPIVKIWDPELGLACDMNVNNTLALENTRMVRTYVEIDDRVRPLAMIIKYWTRRRILNDAAFGGTLSSYSWMCMIIAFLQLQQPPILPALHQRLHQRLPARDGKQSAFADDVDKLRGCGRRNKESLASLLFRFFRFYAHDFDYDKLVLSVRLGKTIPKTEKKWHLSLNNSLCMEEPFNTARNLGNTADDMSFRGLHLELRRAFDLIAEAKLEECCEQFIFPKEEERIWQKPPPAPRPILVRSSSQTHSGRGGRGGFRGGNRQFHRNANNNRRASSSVAYENNTAGGFVQGPMLPQFLPQDPQAALWYQIQQHQHQQQQQPPQLHQDVLGNTLTALQLQENNLRLQENNLRFQLFTQAQAYNQQAALAHAQRIQTGGTTQSATDRARTNSLDNPPLSAPIQQPDMYLYSFPMQPAPYYVQPTYSTYPSSPSTTNNAPEFRRSLHRATVTGEFGLSTSASSLRSQSQPASRTSIIPGQAYPGVPAAPPTLPDLNTQRPRGPIPSFIADENVDSEYDEGPSVPRSESPPDDDEHQYMGYYVGENDSPARQAQPVSHTIPSFGDLTTQGIQDTRRRLSTDQLPQSILDRRMRRTSRSPSPPGHARAFSLGTSSAPLTSAPFPPVPHKAIARNRPLVVNGSAMKQGSTAASSRQASASESMASDDSSYDNALQISSVPAATRDPKDHLTFQMPKSAGAAVPVHDPPVIANGSVPMPSIPAPIPGPESFRRGSGIMNGHVAMSFAARAGDSFASTAAVSAKRLQAMSRQQPVGIAPLDLALTSLSAPVESQHLSPVYEARTPSPTIRRKLELSTSFDASARSGASFAKDRAANAPGSKGHQKAPAGANQLPSKADNGQGPTSLPRVNGLPNRPNGLPPPIRQDGDIASSGGWQKSKARKKANDPKTANGFPYSERLPKNDADRKGG